MVHIREVDGSSPFAPIKVQLSNLFRLFLAIGFDLYSVVKEQMSKWVAFPSKVGRPFCLLIRLNLVFW